MLPELMAGTIGYNKDNFVVFFCQPVKVTTYNIFWLTQDKKKKKKKLSGNNLSMSSMEVKLHVVCGSHTLYSK